MLLLSCRCGLLVLFSCLILFSVIGSVLWLLFYVLVVVLLLMVSVIG